MIAHIVTFQWKPGSDSSVSENLSQALQSFVGSCQGVVSYWCGPDLGLRGGTADFGIVGLFEDETALKAYSTDPEHLRILNELIVPHQQERTFTQIQVLG